MAAQADIVSIQYDEATSVDVHLFGATIISWKYKGVEQLFVSEKSLFDNKKAIRGGIPLVFPNFGPWEKGPQHGFARISRWSVAKTPAKNADGYVEGVFCLEDSESSRLLWDYRFDLRYTVQLGPDSLHIQLDVVNKGSAAFDFTWLVHTYIRVPDIARVTVSDLKGLTYIDKVKNGEKAVESREYVAIAENVDRVYINSPEEHVISNTASGKIILHKSNFPDTVVWNPWKEKAAGMSDFGDKEYPQMICVEAGYVSQRKLLQPGEAFQSAQKMTAAKL